MSLQDGLSKNNLRGIIILASEWGNIKTILMNKI